jgi:hypothetical protein
VQTISAEKAEKDFQNSQDISVCFYKKQDKRLKLMKKLGMQK